METTSIVFQQTLTMAIYMLVGFALFKGGKITKEGSKSLANLLVWLIIPAVIINSFCVELSLEKLRALGLSALLAAVALAVSAAISHFAFKKSPVDNFAAAFSNCGFMGIPLVRAGFGDEAVFLLVGFVVLLNLLQWTYGAALLKGDKGAVSLKGVLLNPITVGTAAGVVLFVTGLGSRLPGVLGGAIGGLAALNSPIAMLVLGIYMAQTSLKETVMSPRLYVLSAVRLLLIPAVTLALLTPLPVDLTMKYVILLGASAPVGANVAVYAQLYGKDYSYACRTVVLSTVLSILTLPVLVAAAGILW
ncbi:MAG: AEC family transporter [Acutalibacter muris]|jgi:predicted permease|uniref:AEC family transporter n=1 Tax=Acutalibacter muris TaxID=1796620 RepID=UPI0025B7A3E4|nr:AEC family transporter [Acutalibacter muris]MCI9545025.1 AEC family transporter [Acutalibacter muris]